MDNHLLTVQVIKEQILAEIVSLFQSNTGSVDVLTVREAFKVYILGHFISVKTSRKTKLNRYGDSLIQQIAELDKVNKDNPSALVQEEMHWLANVLKLLDGKEAAKDIMYEQQSMFEHSDKPGKYLAKQFAEVETNRSSPILDETDQKVVCPQQKVEIFAQYYAELYKSKNPTVNNINDLLSSIPFFLG